jgi:hypothetical protein
MYFNNFTDLFRDIFRTPMDINFACIEHWQRGRKRKHWTLRDTKTSSIEERR